MSRLPMRVMAIVAVLVATLLIAGCGGDEVRRAAEDVRQRAELARERAQEVQRDVREIRESARQISDRLRRRVREVLDQMEQAVPAASRPTPVSAGRTADSEVEAYLDEVIHNIDRYWTDTLRQAGLPEPRVGFVTVDPGARAFTGCRVVADDTAAFYCTRDDTIYIAEQLASDLWQGINDDFPGQRAGYGRAIGDFGLAYVVAHEYAHNVQNELGFYRLRPRGGVMAFELQADCMAGLWGNSVYRAGRLQPGDVEEAMSTALAAGDFDYNNEQHHGTPQQRRSAWLLGYESGEPSRCRELVS